MEVAQSLHDRQGAPQCVPPCRPISPKGRECHTWLYTPTPYPHAAYRRMLITAIYVSAGGSLTRELVRLHPQQEHEHGGRLLSSSSEHGEATQTVGAVKLVGSPSGGSPLQATPVPRQVLPHPTSPNNQPPPQLQLQDPGHSSGSAQHSPWAATPRPLHQPALQASPGTVQGPGTVPLTSVRYHLTCNCCCCYRCVSLSSAACCCWVPSVSMSPAIYAAGALP